MRENASARYFFIQNWNEKSITVNLKSEFINVDNSEEIEGDAALDKYETLILKQVKGASVY